MTRPLRSRQSARLLRPVPEVWMYVKDPGKLRRQRKTKRLTQEQMAVFARCSQQYISLLESGRDRDCSEDIACRIAAVLEIDLEDYFEAREVVRTPSVTTASRGGSAA